MSRLLTIPEVAEHLGVSRWRVYAYMNADEDPLPYVQLPNGRRRVSEQALAEYIERNTIRAGGAT